MKKQRAKHELIKETRQKAELALKLCNQVEDGKISGEEFERRLSKVVDGVRPVIGVDPWWEF